MTAEVKLWLESCENTNLRDYSVKFAKNSLKMHCKELKALLNIRKDLKRQGDCWINTRAGINFSKSAISHQIRNIRYFSLVLKQLNTQKEVK